MLLLRGATRKDICIKQIKLVSIHAPLARSNRRLAAIIARHDVSIHAPLARSNSAVCGDSADSGVSIHAPLARSNLLSQIEDETQAAFQYMLLLRGATGLPAAEAIKRTVSIHAPLARSNVNRKNHCRPPSVSIHAPLARSNPVRLADVCQTFRFQYMLLLRGATGVI